MTESLDDFSPGSDTPDLDPLLPGKKEGPSVINVYTVVVTVPPLVN